MDDPWRDWIPPHPHWDAVLRLVPAHVFIFDSTLTCRYAAPTGEVFLDRSPEQLTGRHASEILPPAANGLRPMLERAAQEGSRWSAPQYRYSHHAGEAEISYVWAIEVEPLTAAGQQGVLVTLRDVLELVEERDQLRALNEEREQKLRISEERVRTSLTAAWGYLQLLGRHPNLFRDASVASIIEGRVLPRLHEVLQTVEALEQLPRSDEKGA